MAKWNWRLKKSQKSQPQINMSAAAPSTGPAMRDVDVGADCDMDAARTLITWAVAGWLTLLTVMGGLDRSVESAAGCN
jgi:hypothetical protein